jgi:hypothetical protein
MALRASYLRRFPLPLPASCRGDGKRKSATHRRRPLLRPGARVWPRGKPCKGGPFGPRLRRLSALTGLATRPPFATNGSTAGSGRPPLTIHAEKAPQSLRKVLRMGTLFDVRMITLVDGCGLNEPTAPAQRGFSSWCRRAGCIGPINYRAQNLR